MRDPMQRRLTDAQIAAISFDEMNASLADGRASRADGAAFRDEWNASGKHFHTAMLFGCRLFLSEGQPIATLLAED